MGQNLIMPIILVVFILAFGIYSVVNKSKTKKSGAKVGKGAKEEQLNSYKGVQKEVPKKDMSSFIRFDKIANDMIYQKKGEKFTMVIECKGINYELMSEVEQMAVEEGFITFLNTLKYPIQLYVQTRSIDLGENIKKYKARANEFELKRQEAVAKYNQAEDDIDSTPEEITELKQQKLKYSNIAEYVSDITKYVERMALNKYLLQRKFYVVLSYNKSEIVTTEKFSKEEYEDMCYRELYTRAQGIIGSLMACSVQGKVLTSNQLAELIYISFNKDDEKTLNIRNALESGFYRLYSTSDDVRMKRQEALDEEIRKESLKRVEAAIVEGIEKGTIMLEDEYNAEVDKKIDKTALKLVDSSTLNVETKEEIKNIIMTNRKEKLRKREELKNKETEESQNPENEEQVVQDVQEQEINEEPSFEESKIEVSSEIISTNNDTDDESIV